MLRSASKVLNSFGRRCYCESKPIERSLNMVQLLGRVGQEPKIGGSATKKVVNFSLATSINYQSKGTPVSKTTWHNISVFQNGLQDKVCNYVEKGSRLMIVGSIETSTYDDSMGVRRTSTSIIPDDIIILSTPKREM